MNANLLFGWRRLYQRGVPVEEEPCGKATLLPVKVSTPTLTPTERAHAATTKVPAKESRGGSIEIEFAGGVRLRVRGRVDRPTLARVMSALSRR